MAAYGLGYLLSVSLPLQSAHVVGVVSAFGFTVFSGISPTLSSVYSGLGPLRVLWDVSFARYAVEACVVAETEAVSATGSPFAESTKLWMDDAGFGTGGIGVFWQDVGIMISIGIGFRILAGLVLWYRTRKQRARTGFVRRVSVSAMKKLKLWPLVVMGLSFMTPAARAVTLTEYVYIIFLSSSRTNSSILDSNGICNFCGAAIFPICDCPAGFYCSNVTRPFCEKCPSGSYCPVTGDVQPLPCPSGSWCPGNVFVPISCESGAVCTSDRTVYILGIIFCFFILLLALILHLWIRGYFAGCFGLVLKLWNRKKNGPSEEEDARELDLVEEVDVPESENEASEEEEEEENVENRASDRFDITLTNVSVKRGMWLSYPVPWKNWGAHQVLSNINGKFPNGQLIAIMVPVPDFNNRCIFLLTFPFSNIKGPSGSGKTTLLKVLRGALPINTGTIEVNGQLCEKGLSQFNKVLGMVPQDDDTVDPLLTVEQALRHSARLRLPGGTSYKEKNREVEAALALLSLEGVRDQLVGTGLGGSSSRGVSGGQRRRTNIGVELAARPSLLLLDEPTSGLDSHVAALVVEGLKRITQEKGVTIIATIHQPSQRVFEQFDTLVLLGTAGRIVYWGPPRDAVGHFTSTLGKELPSNTADPDFLLDTLSAENDADAGGTISLADAWQKQEEQRDLLGGDDSSKSAAEGEGFVMNPSDSDSDDERGSKTTAEEASSIASLPRRLWAALISRLWGHGGRRTPMFHMQLAIQLMRQIQRTLRTLVSSFLLSCVIFGFSGTCLALAFTGSKFDLPTPQAITQWCPQAIRDFTDSQSWDQPCNPVHPNNEVQGLAVMYFCMLLGCIAAALSVWTFGGDKGIYRRESASGSNTLAYFLAANLTDAIKCMVYALFFLSCYFPIATPYGTFSNYWVLCYCFLLVTYGYGYIISFLLRPANAAIVGALVAVSAGLFSGLVFGFTPFWTFFFGEGLFQAEVQYVVDNFRDYSW